MRVLMVASGNGHWIYGVSSFVYEQTLALRKKGIDVEIFPIKGKGVWGYLKAAIELNKLLKRNHFDIIHGHYIYSSLVTILQFRVPVVATFIGSDINVPKYRLLSQLTIFNRAKSLIFVSEKLKNISGYNKRCNVIPYGLDLNKFYPIDRQIARDYLHWQDNEIYIFFASRFDRIIKNAQLAFDAIEILKQNGLTCKLVEFINIKAEDLNYYYNASDIFLLTSFYEGSPQSIKESLACNCPIVATDVGDIKWILGKTDGCYLSSFNAKDVAEKLKQVLLFNEKKGRTKGRHRIIELGIDSESVAKRISEVYEETIKA